MATFRREAALAAVDSGLSGLRFVLSTVSSLVFVAFGALITSGGLQLWLTTEGHSATFYGLGHIGLELAAMGACTLFISTLMVLRRPVPFVKSARRARRLRITAVLLAGLAAALLVTVPVLARAGGSGTHAILARCAIGAAAVFVLVLAAMAAVIARQLSHPLGECDDTGYQAQSAARGRFTRP